MKPCRSGRVRSMTPAMSRHAHVFAAAALWSGAGAGLATVGLSWTLGSATGRGPVLAAALVVGYLKYRYILSRTARRIVSRIEARGDSRCIGGFLSWRSWALVLGFSLGGRLLRATPIPAIVLGGIYVAVGVALLLSSGYPWASWWRGRRRAVSA